MGSYFGLSAAELGDLPETACSGGFEKIWRAWQGFLTQEIEGIQAAFEAEKARSEAGSQDFEAVAADPEKWACTRAVLPERRDREIAQIEALRVAPPPMWRIVSGLEPNERGMSPGARASGIRRLLKNVEKVARTEIRAEGSRRGGDWRRTPTVGAAEANADITDVEERRCYAWDPLRSICFYLGIARTKLGAYAWELWGLSATQMIDRVKCESVRGTMREEMRTFAREFLLKYEGAEGEAVAEAWKAFRGSRGGVAYRTSLAAKFGYSSYAKFSRACLMCYGVEPSELEFQELEEAVLSELTEPSRTTQCAEVERERTEGGKQNAEGGGDGFTIVD